MLNELTYSQVYWTCLVVFGLSIAILSVILLKTITEKLFNFYQVISNRLVDRRNTRHLPDIVQQKMLHRSMTTQENMPGWAVQWLARIENKTSISGVPIRTYLLLASLLSVLGLTAGILVLNNIYASIALVLAAVYMPRQLLGARMQKRRLKIQSQLAPAISLFAAEFSTVPQVQRALEETARELPEPIRGAFEKCVRELKAGLDKDIAFSRMTDNLQVEYGVFFTHLLRIAWDDATVAPQFPRLANKLTQYEELEQINDKGLAWMRAVGIFLNLLLIPAFLAVKIIVPDAGYFLVNDPLGKAVVALAFLSLPLGILLDNRLHKVDY